MIVLIALLYLHIVSSCYSIYVHRYLCHKSIKLTPEAEKFFEFMLWLMFGGVPRDFPKYHIKHHSRADKNGDPHSPVLQGKAEIMFYKPLRKIIERLKILNNGMLYFLLLNVLMFGFDGIIIFVLFVFLTYFGMSFVDGFGHTYGYTNFKLKNNSKNFFPIGFLLGGEELHNNHHKNPKRYDFSYKKWEFDISAKYITLLKKLGYCE